MIECTKCKIEKDITEFRKDKSKKLGRSSQCKECISEYQKKYRNKPQNKLKSEEYRKQWYNENSTPELRSKYFKKSYSNKEFRKQHNIRTREWIKSNPNYMKEWFENNREEYNKKRRERWANNPEFRVKSNVRTRIYKSIKDKTNASFKLLGCKIEEYFVYLEQQFDENMNWDNYGSYWEIDHIIPLNKGGSFHYKNTQPLTITENRKKSDK